MTAVGSDVRHAQQLQVAVGGPAGSLGDLTSVTKSRIWLDIAILAIAMALVLGLATRAVLLPAVATAFSLLVAASTFGVLQLLFGGTTRRSAAPATWIRCRSSASSPSRSRSPSPVPPCC